MGPDQVRRDAALEAHAAGLRAIEGENLDGARERFAAAVALDPGLARAWTSLGAVCGELGDVATARAAFERAIAAGGGREARSNLAVLEREAGRLDASERSLRDLLQTDPDFVFGHYNLGHTLFLAGRFSEAAEAIARGQRLDPLKSPRHAGRMGLALLAATEERRGLRELRRAASALKPASPLVPPEPDARSILDEWREIAAGLRALAPDLRGLEKVSDLLDELERHLGSNDVNANAEAGTGRAIEPAGPQTGGSLS